MRANRFDWSTYEGVRAYYRQYEEARRNRLRRRRLCVTCGNHPAKRGRAKNGQRRTRCPRCIDRQARFNAAHRRRQWRKSRRKAA